jgi:hypothetical protein
MSIKGRSRALVREGGRAGEQAGAQGSRSLSLSPTRTLVTPYCKRICPRRRKTRGHGFPLLFSPLCSVSRRPIWAGTRSDNLLIGPGTPRGRNADSCTILPRRPLQRESGVAPRLRRRADYTRRGTSSAGIPPTKEPTPKYPATSRGRRAGPGAACIARRGLRDRGNSGGTCLQGTKEFLTA